MDEAYIDFVDHEHDSVSLLARHENLIILRTLSKGYSLAGLRFGYGIANRELITPMMDKTRDSYNLDAISQQLAVAALEDQPYAESTWNRVIESRLKLAESLRTAGFDVLPSQANFLLVTVPMSMNCSAETIYQKLKEKHILVRYFAQDRLRDKLRISVGTAEENQQLLATLKDLLD